ncbi:hypothetical protein HMPREF3141_06750 [Pseudomonas sp. HMSC16B01]|nr:hypothetical protein HMPREF3141_06750 [Pseudomonas sp. HMSC16B01]
MLRDGHQFIVCIERTALTEDDRIRVHDASHHLRFLGLRREGCRFSDYAKDAPLFILAGYRYDGAGFVLGDNNLARGLRQGGAGTVSVGSAFRAKRRAAAPHLHSVSTWEDVPMPDVCTCLLYRRMCRARMDEGAVARRAGAFICFVHGSFLQASVSRSETVISRRRRSMFSSCRTLPRLSMTTQ